MTPDPDVQVDHADTVPLGDSTTEHPQADTSDVIPEHTDDLETEVLTDAQVEALKDDPTTLRKSLQKAFTQKTQKLSELRKELEPFKDLIDAYREDPSGTAELLARQAGFEVKKPLATPEAEDDPIQDVQSALSEALGPEYEDLAAKLGPGLAKAIERYAAKVTKPIQDLQTQQLHDSMIREADQEMKTFGESHPDWKQYEPEMNRLATLIEPKRGATVDPQEFLDILYARARGKKDVADATKKVIAKMVRGTDGSSAEPGTVSADKVALTPTSPLTFKQAAEFARAGRRIE